jgi:hypothetical protein
MAMIVIDRDPSARALRQFAGLFLVASGVVGFLVLRRAGSLEGAVAVWTLGAVVCVAGLFRPRAIRLVYLGLAYLAFPIGWVVSHILLALVLYLVLTPIGLMLRLFGKDPLERRFDAEAASYWTPHQRADSMERYFRQF